MTYSHSPLEFTPPPVAMLSAATAPLRGWFAPRFMGMEHFKVDKPMLMVGNHTLLGVVDVPLLITEIYRRTGVLVRSLADHAHYDVPGWRALLDRFGAAEGTRENCRALMQRGEHLMVFPGGAREVAKRKGEEYQLTWKKRTGFCRMAIENGYDILPFASVGPDDMADILIDADDVVNSPVGTLMRRFGWLEKEGPLRGGDIIMPLVRGLGPTGIPRPERFYFALGEPISVKPYQDLGVDESSLFALRDEVAFAIEDLIADLMIHRENDKPPALWRRVLTSL